MENIIQNALHDRVMLDRENDKEEYYHKFLSKYHHNTDDFLTSNVTESHIITTSGTLFDVRIFVAIRVLHGINNVKIYSNNVNTALCLNDRFLIAAIES